MNMEHHQVMRFPKQEHQKPKYRSPEKTNVIGVLGRLRTDCQFLTLVYSCFLNNSGDQYRCRSSETSGCPTAANFGCPSSVIMML